MAIDATLCPSSRHQIVRVRQGLGEGVPSLPFGDRLDEQPAGQLHRGAGLTHQLLELVEALGMMPRQLVDARMQPDERHSMRRQQMSKNGLR